MRLGGEICRDGSGSKDSIPGSRRVCCWFVTLAMGGAGFGWIWPGVRTLLRWLVFVLKFLVSGCQVRRRQASSALDDVESRRPDQPEVGVVGEARWLLAAGE